jgi:hypothetical protein
MSAVSGFSSPSAQINYYTAIGAIQTAEVAVFDASIQIRADISARCKGDDIYRKERLLGLMMVGYLQKAVNAALFLPEDDFQPQIPRMQNIFAEMRERYKHYPDVARQVSQAAFSMNTRSLHMKIHLSSSTSAS